MPLKQWINLKRESKYVEDDVSSIKRLGPLHFECTFSKSTKRIDTLKVKIEDVSVPNQYTVTEKKRCKWFKIQWEKQTRSVPVNSKNVRIERDVYLPAAGGNTYKVSAKYKQKVVSSTKTIETWRKLYYQAVHMQGINVPDLSAMESEYKSYYIIFNSKDPEKQVPLVNNTDSDTRSERLQVIREASAGYTMTRYDPYVACVYFVNMIASKKEKRYDVRTAKQEFTLWPGILAWFGSTIEYTVPEGNYLWWGVSKKDDMKNGGKGIWLVPNSAYYIGNDNKRNRIPDDNIKIDLTKTRTDLGGYNKLIIELPWKARDFWSASTLKIGITLVIVSGFCGGYSEPYVNIVTVAKSGWWVEDSDSARIQVLLHELGHKIGMVPNGTMPELDKPTHFYTGKGHQGPHCQAGGLTYDSNRKLAWHGVPSCVMYGATCCYDPTIKRYKQTTEKFCADCQKLVRKLNLYTSDLRNFKNSVKDETLF